ncbi:MAG TPA: FkbM family methyltransferase [Ignavibacteriales bacterium]|nr:FkbM family methyltransferase [Ignavibacteriales bacterium]HPD66645.1 FkbM family methyltransferase [Ignavibacteriales bacterium]HRR17575.1 FkbM family methyltransferase [Ignavibacteriales bacterium]HRT98064.1 FkbM family methyltransferase [Ignavibacteriales bacterium]
MNIKKIVRNLFRSFGYEITKIGDLNLLPSLIYKYHHKDFFFIQIGANDGISFDPIYDVVKKLKLSGIAIEPVKDYYEDLVKNYKNSNVITVNKAIYEKSGKISIYRVKNDNDLPKWSKGIASLNPEHYKKSNVDKSYIIEEIVDAFTFENLFEIYKVQRIDLLQIDAEGYDYTLLKLFPFDKFQPSIIHFEHGLRHENMSINQLYEIITMLLNYNYKIIMKDYDCLAYK